MNTSVAPAAKKPTIIPSITRANLGLNIPRLDEKLELGADANEHKKKLDERIAKYAVCYRLGGRVNKSRPTKGRGDKEGVQFKGEFQARMADALGGQWFYSGRAHLPAFFEEMLYAQLIAEQEGDPKATVEFLVDIGAKPPAEGKPSITGYEWTVTPVVEVARQSDPLADLFARAGMQPALAAPTAPVADPTSPVMPETSKEPARHARGKAPLSV